MFKIFPFNCLLKGKQKHNNGPLQNNTQAEVMRKHSVSIYTQKISLLQIIQDENLWKNKKLGYCSSYTVIAGSELKYTRLLFEETTIISCKYVWIKTNQQFTRKYLFSGNI